MKTKRKRIEIVSETTTVLILKNSKVGARQSWCGQCAAEVFWIARAEINLFGISELPESGASHKNDDFFCSRSLIEEIKKEKNYENNINEKKAVVTVLTGVAFRRQ